MYYRMSGLSRKKATGFVCLLLLGLSFAAPLYFFELLFAASRVDYMISYVFLSVLAQLDFECYAGARSHGGFYCGLDYVRLTECARSQGEFFVFFNL